MKPSVVTQAQVHQRVTARWGDIQADEALLELVRAEVTARRSCQRWTVLRRVAQSVAGAAWEPMKERLADLCVALENEGDLTAAAGGVLHVSPVRAIRLQEGLHRVVCSLPTVRLAERLPGELEVSGVRRNHRFETSDAATAEDAVRALGGLVVSPRAWAGLELAPIADRAWLNSLAQRLAWQHEPAGSLERDGALDWSALTLTDEGPRWHRKSEDPTGLWRARNPFGRWWWAWCATSHLPSTGEFVKLSNDDASRTVFAVARVAERPISCALVRNERVAHMQLREWLPRAEYRYLAMLATRAVIDDQFQWSIPVSRLDGVLETLRSRLGLNIATLEVAEAART